MGLSCTNLVTHSMAQQPLKSFDRPLITVSLSDSILVTVLSLFPSFSLPDVLCDPTDLIWRKGTPFEAMTGRTAPSIDALLAKVFWGFPQL